ncbi:MAG: low temperature requirement protein A [Actinobacteria bacterium]|nr:MAG: low temperature requirement protein A [Actinomycetota bacterium]
MSDQHAEPEHRVTPLEFYFDLVFVLAFTQITTVLSDNATWGGLGHACSSLRRSGGPGQPSAG